MSLTPEQVKRVQQFLVRAGHLVGVPSETWTAPALEGLKQYQLSVGVQYPACQFIPEDFTRLSAEMRAAVNGQPDPSGEVKAVAPVETAPQEPAKTEETPKVPTSDTAIRIPKKRK